MTCPALWWGRSSFAGSSGRIQQLFAARFASWINHMLSEKGPMYQTSSGDLVWGFELSERQTQQVLRWLFLWCSWVTKETKVSVEPVFLSLCLICKQENHMDLLFYNLLVQSHFFTCPPDQHGFGHCCIQTSLPYCFFPNFLPRCVQCSLGWISLCSAKHLSAPMLWVLIPWYSVTSIYLSMFISLLGH